MTHLPPRWASVLIACLPLVSLACRGSLEREEVPSAAPVDASKRADAAVPGDRVEGDDVEGGSDAPTSPPEADGDATPPTSGDRTPATPPVPAPDAGSIGIRVEAVSSSTVTVGWDGVPGASGYVLYVGAEPPAGDDGVLPGAVQVARLARDETVHRIEGLGAGTDVFVRVTVSGSEAPFGVTHARTDGGPGTSLDGPLRATHAYGPNTLLLVLSNPGTRHTGGLEGNTGPAWQAGRWTVERGDGRTVGIRAVHRESIPVAQPAYPVGFERWGDDSVVDVDHRIFVVLEEPLGGPDVFRVRHEGGAGTELDVRVPFSDRYLETPLVQLNQVGYSPRASRRWAYVSGWMGDGGSVGLETLPGEASVIVEPTDALAPRAVATGGLALQRRASDDAEAGGPVAEVDLSGVPTVEGRRYRIHLPGVGVSFPTAVSEEAMMRSFYTVARGLYHNRWCGDLDPGFTEWSRPEDHCEAFFVTGRSYRQTMFEAGTPQVNPRPVRGGHHDAGDFDIRPYHVVAGQYLLRAYEMGAERLEDGQLTLPESGNGIPDLLDEALWNLAAWQDLQNPDGSIRAGVESHRHPAGVYEAHEDRLPYWTFDPEPWHTAYVAALFAQAARLVQPFDAARSAELEEDARAAYDADVARGAPDAYRLYAASELAALTGEARFVSEFEARWAALDRHGGGPFDFLQDMLHVYPGSFDQGFAMADFVLGYASSEAADPRLVEVIRERVRERADAASRAILESPHAHRLGRPVGDPPEWGHTTSTGRHGDFIYQALQLGGLGPERRQRYFDALSVAADYALGANPLGLVYLSGLGSRSPQQPLHLDSLASIKKGLGPVPGIPVYGPVRSLPSVSYYAPVRAAFHPAFERRALGRRYADSRTSVNTAEFTVWESQAPFAELFSVLVAPGMHPPATWLPGGTWHREPLPEHWSD